MIENTDLVNDFMDFELQGGLTGKATGADKYETSIRMRLGQKLTLKASTSSVVASTSSATSSVAQLVLASSDASLAINTVGDNSIDLKGYSFASSDASITVTTTPSSLVGGVWQPGSVGLLGAVHQIISATASATATSAVVPIDNTIPQSSEGATLMNLNITPKRIGSKILVFFNGMFQNDNANSAVTAALIRSSAANSVAAQFANVVSVNGVINLTLTYIETTASLSTINYEIRFGPANGAHTATAAPAAYGGVELSYLYAIEVG